jgi:hypothetical protein
MRNFVRELGFFLLFLAVALCLAPAVLQAMRLTSEASYTNRLEELFLIQISFIVILVLVALQYLLRFLATMIIRWTGGQAAGGDTP